MALRSDYDSKNLSVRSKYITADINDDKYCNFIIITIDIALIKTKATHWKYFWWSVCSVRHTERQFGLIQQEVSCMATVKLYVPSLMTLYTSHTLTEVL